MNTRKALAFVRERGIVLEAARGPVPSLAEEIAGEPIRGSWWGHHRGRDIFRLTRAVRRSPDVLVCRLVEGKITYVHRRLWPALVRVADSIDREGLAALRETHTESGKHHVEEIPFPEWVPDDVRREANRLDESQAAESLPTWLVDR